MRKARDGVGWAVWETWGRGLVFGVGVGLGLHGWVGFGLGGCGWFEVCCSPLGVSTLVARARVRLLMTSGTVSRQF